MNKLNYLAHLAAGVALLGVFSSHAQAEGDTLFKAKCAVCHGADGKGETAAGKANKLNDLGSPDIQKQSDSDLTGIISNGKNKMPGYGKTLKPEQIKDLVAYIRGFAKKIANRSNAFRRASRRQTWPSPSHCFWC
jgi:cytochrome c6